MLIARGSTADDGGAVGFDGEVWRVGGAEEGGRGGVGEGGEGDVGEILIDDVDFPWLGGRFAAGPAYPVLRELFARELALAGRDDEEHWKEWEAVYDEIRRRVTLSSPDGPVPEFLLHIEGDRAWFRWSDEAFDDEG